MHRIDVTAKRSLVLKLRQTLLALVGKVLGVDLDMLEEALRLEEALGANPAAVLGEGVAGPIADVTRQRRRMLELFQTVGALMLAVVMLPGMFGQAGWGFERFGAVATLVLAASGVGQAEDGRRNEARSFGRSYG